jgi:hypothetical protein
LIQSCSSLPMKSRSPQKPKISFDGKSVASLVLNNYSTENKDTLAITGAVLTVTKSPKAVPDLPENAKALPKSIMDEALSYDLDSTQIN